MDLLTKENEEMTKTSTHDEDPDPPQMIYPNQNIEIVFTPIPIVIYEEIMNNVMIIITTIYLVSKNWKPQKELTIAAKTTYITLAIIQLSREVWKDVKKKNGKRGKADDFTTIQVARNST